MVRRGSLHALGGLGETPPPQGEGLSYLDEMRLAKMVRGNMPQNGRRSMLQRTQTGSRNLLADLSPSRRTSTNAPQTRGSMLTDSAVWRSMKNYFDESDSEKGSDSDDDEVGPGRRFPLPHGDRRSSLCNASAWKSMAKFVADVDDGDHGFLHNQTDDLHMDEGDGHDAVHTFYTKPMQRQLWGDPHLVVHIGWNTLFFDLFYVVAAYNLGNMLISCLNNDQWGRGVVYLIGIFGGLYNIFLRCMLYDSQFAVHDYAHRLLEVVRIFLVSIVVLHIKSVELLMDPKSVEAFALTTAMFLETLVHVLLNLELLWFAEGDRIAIQNQAKRELVTNLLPVSLLYFIASVFSGVMFIQKTNGITISSSKDGYLGERSYYDESQRVLGESDSENVSKTGWNVGDVPLLICFAVVLVSITIQAITATRLTPKNPTIRSLMVPMNIDFFIHRFGEFTMLFFGEAVMGLLIVQTTESHSYYTVALVGVLSVVVLQAFKYESEPHGDGEQNHCLWKGMKPFFVYMLLTQALCLGLIAFAVSYKVGLKYLVSEHEEAIDEGNDYGEHGNDDNYYWQGNSNNPDYVDGYGNATNEGDVRMLAAGVPKISSRAIAAMYCSSLAIILVSIELMAYSHKGLKKTYSLFVSNGKKSIISRIQWKRLFGTLFKLILFAFVSTLYIWVKNLGLLICIGFVISVIFAISKVMEHLMKTNDKVKKVMERTSASLKRLRDSSAKKFRSSHEFNATTKTQSCTKGDLSSDPGSSDSNASVEMDEQAESICIDTL